jgi:hypothetical protein
MTTVILESPYAGNLQRHIRYARAAMRDSLLRGEAPMVSHLLYTQVLDDETPAERTRGIAAGLAWPADKTVVYTDCGISRGMEHGIRAAQRAGRPIEYRTVEGWEEMNFTPEPPQKLMIDKIIKQDIVYALVGMGIGKTASVLSAFCQLQLDLEVNSMLVIAPMRVCNLTWPMEVQQWDQFKHLKVANLRTPLGRRAFIGGMADIYLINYESIHTLVKLVEKRGDTLPYQMIVYDESTKCKNPAVKG